MADPKKIQLIAPTNISTKAGSKGEITVTWEDTNANPPKPTDKTYTVYFMPKPDGPAAAAGKFAPPKTAVPKSAVPKGRKTPTLTLDIALTGTPDGTTLAKDYLAYVVANGDPAKNTESSPPGIQAYWHVQFGITITIGGKSFSLSSDDAGSKDGIYRLPIPKPDPAHPNNNPFSVTYQDLASFAKKVGLEIPTKQPDGTPIDPKGEDALKITKMAYDTKHRLFEIDIQLAMKGVTPLPGISVDHLDMSLERTDGVHPL